MAAAPKISDLQAALNSGFSAQSGQIGWSPSGSFSTATSEMVQSLLSILTVEPTVKIEHDFYGWLLYQAEALRGRRSLALDWDNLAEELEAMAAADRRELLRRLTSLFEHLLKLAYQPAELSRRGNGWRRTVVNSRIEIEQLLRFGPGLKGYLDEFAVEAYAGACRKTGAAMGLRRDQWEERFPKDSPWTISQALDADFFPA
jgi:hypothetical protein